jgi:hypothetical protein
VRASARHKQSYEKRSDFRAVLRRQLHQAIRPSPRADTASDPDHDKRVAGEAIGVVHTRVFAIFSQASKGRFLPVNRSGSSSVARAESPRYQPLVRTALNLISMMILYGSVQDDIGPHAAPTTRQLLSNTGPRPRPFLFSPTSLKLRREPQMRSFDATRAWPLSPRYPCPNFATEFGFFGGIVGTIENDASVSQ